MDKGSSVVPPRPGQTGHYVCGECGKRFMHKIPLLFDLGIKCPACGSFKVGQDTKVIH
jgi:DNA-directed RNA polymerase subunit RPC12/RpoP